MGKRRVSESEDSLIAGPVKKSKTKGGSEVGSATVPKVTADGDEYWEIPEGSKRRVVLSSFRNMPLVSVREYYADNNSGGEMKPGKKGISLTVQQFAAIVEALPAIERSLKKRGHEIPRPDYGGGEKGSMEQERGDDGEDDDEGAADEDEDVEIKDEGDGSDDDEDLRRAKKPSAIKSSHKKREKSRKNFEETSDEEED